LELAAPSPVSSQELQIPVPVPWATAKVQTCCSLPNSPALRVPCENAVSAVPESVEDVTPDFIQANMPVVRTLAPVPAVAAAGESRLRKSSPRMIGIVHF